MCSGAQGRVHREEVSRNASENQMTAVGRHCRRPAAYYTLITFDGSLTGGGATLQAGVPSLSAASSKQVVAYTSLRWTQDDLEMVIVRAGDPAGQARLEALTLATALETWKGLLTSMHGALAVRGDALGVLRDVIKLRAKDPVLNQLAHTMALPIAPTGVDLRAAHVWSEKNTLCDLLSRRASESSLDHPELKAAKYVVAKRVKL